MKCGRLSSKWPKQSPPRFDFESSPFFGPTNLCVWHSRPVFGVCGTKLLQSRKKTEYRVELNFDPLVLPAAIGLQQFPKSATVEVGVVNQESTLGGCMILVISSVILFVINTTSRLFFKK